jgi:hypothetical protein
LAVTNHYIYKLIKVIIRINRPTENIIIHRFATVLGLVRLFPEHMDWMGLEKNEKRFDLFGFQTHPISLNPHGLRANRTSPYSYIPIPLT